MNSKIFAVAVGVAVFQGLTGLFAAPARAAWGWESNEQPKNATKSGSSDASMKMVGFATVGLATAQLVSA